jgi:hypothetical protein
VAVVALSTVVAVSLDGGGGDDRAAKQPVGGASVPRQADSGAARPTSGSPAPSSASPSAGKSKSASPKRDAKSSAPSGGAAGRTGAAQRPDAADDTVPLTVSTRTHAWAVPPCGVTYLVNRLPTQVLLPPEPLDAPDWVNRTGAVPAGEQRIALTVQGTGDETVVIESIHVRVLRKGAPLPWNVFDMAAGCGGNVSTRSFDVNLDAAQPAAVPKAGQRGFPYRVSESEPEVLYVTARAGAHDVSWVIDIQWSSGGRQDKLRVDDHGKPFRTSGMAGRPYYEYLPGSTEWAESLDPPNV